MSDLNMQLTREFFELNLFHVLTYWQHDLPAAQLAEPGLLLFVENRNPQPRDRGAGFLLRPEELPFIQRAVVEVRGWHTERFYASTIERSPGVGYIAGPEARRHAQSILESAEFATILVVSELPNTPEQRDRSIQAIRGQGIDHVIEFPTLLQDILNRISAHGNYAPSQTLQTMRLLKRYGFIRRQQLEFPFAAEPPPPAREPQVDASDPPEERGLTGDEE